MPPPLRRIGLFGGTFDPVHLGHLILAERAVEVLKLDRLYLVPNAASPLKAKPPVATGAERLALVRAAIRGNPKLGALELEIRRPPPSFTFDTVAALKGAGSVKLFFLIGTDALLDFARWHRVRELAKRVTLAVVRRPGSERVRPPAWAGRWVDVEAPLIEISSSGVRERLRRGRSIRYLVPDAVGAAIRKRGLYRRGASSGP